MIEKKDGKVYRDGVLIGTVDGDKLIVPEKLHHQTVKKIEAETGLTITLGNAEGNAGDMGNPISGQVGIGNADIVVSSPASTVEDEGFAEESAEKVTTSIGISIDPEPPKDHRGDKTPAYIDWLFRNRPEEANRRYANRKISR